MLVEKHASLSSSENSSRQGFFQLDFQEIIEPHLGLLLSHVMYIWRECLTVPVIELF